MTYFINNQVSVLLFSTDTCLTYLTDFIRHGMDNGLYTGMVMIDPQKAFDTVNHSLLSDKLQALGLNNVSVSWFDSYLTNRTQKVDINGTFFQTQDALWCTTGFHYGSIAYMLMTWNPQ